MLHDRCTALRSCAHAMQVLMWHKSSYRYAFDETPTGSRAVLEWRSQRGFFAELAEKGKLSRAHSRARRRYWERKTHSPV
jgi:hypothetical protein